MQPLKPIQVFVPVSIDDELPEVNQHNIIIQATHTLNRVVEFQLREASFQSDMTDNSEPYFSVGKRANDQLYVFDKITHWLKEKELYVFDRKQLKELLEQTYFEGGYNEAEGLGAGASRDEYINQLLPQ